MKKVIAIALFFASYGVRAQTTNDVLNLLVQEKIVSAENVDSLRADFAVKQQSVLPDKKVKFDFEYRSRGEYRQGYSDLLGPRGVKNGGSFGEDRGIAQNAAADSLPAYFVNQRSRLSVNYIWNNKLGSQLSVQDLRVWGQQDPKSTSGTVQVYEAYVEPYFTPSLSLRVGRQRLSFDNQRLFAENNWRVGGVAHDAANLRFVSDKLSSDLALAFNQTKESTSSTDVGSNFSNYKFLVVNYLKYKVNDVLTVSIINAADGYQSQPSGYRFTEGYNFRFTDGGRIEVEKGNWYATVAAYFQGGKNVQDGRKLKAWYVQPEVKYTAPFKLVARLGAEVFSGQTNNPGDVGAAVEANTTDRSFVALYGSAHSFNGSLDLITKPSDYGNAGLVNPYLVLVYPVSQKLELRTDVHYFRLLEDYYTYNTDKKTKLITKKDKQKADLGIEGDVLVSYKPNALVKIDAGVSYAQVEDSFVATKRKGINSVKTPFWGFMSLTVKPQLFTASFK